ncbi:unnamed protein product [Rotaria socialis]|uniref:G-protein coupled receptors family 1 profile domain-containing protein n=2 Tax=Rotaria socialis TaxID=392032 RepID=A0A818PJC4_9BILA|nr:unnamed protein product [Rotaria socialis]
MKTTTNTEKNLIVDICIYLVMPCVVFIGIIGNVLSILVFARREMIKFRVFIFAIVLAVSNIFLLTTSVFNIILPDFYGEFLTDKSVFWCHFHGYFDLLLTALSSYSVLCISVERWFSVCMPFKNARYVNFKTVLLTVISYRGASAPAQNYTSVSTFVSLWLPFTVNYTWEQRKCELLRPTVYKVCGIISIIVTHIVPFVFLVILDILIVHRLKTNHYDTSMQHSVLPKNNRTATNSSTRKRIKRQGNVDRNITFMLITVGVTFMVMTFPYPIYWLYVQIRQTTMSNKTVFILTQTFRYLNCCCHFFIYSAASSLFCRELRKMFRCIKHRDRKLNNDQRTKPFNTMNKRDILPEHKNLL